MDMPLITGTLAQSRRGSRSAPGHAPAALPHRDRGALRDAAPALRDLTASVDAQAD
jgi:hypothetical protein